MQRSDELSSVTELDIPGMETLEGRFCETTRRVVIISPYPATVRSLFLALTIRCYDVFVFHHEHDPVLQSIESDLWIIDRTLPERASAPLPDIKPGTSMPPVLFLYKKSSEEQTISEANGLLWPCPVDQAIGKIEELAKQSSVPGEPANHLLRFKDVVMDLKRITVTRQGAKVELTKTEFDLLKVLLLNSGGVMTRQELMDKVWGEDYFGGSNSVDVHIKGLRQKLGDDPRQPRYIATVRGVGYRIAD